MTDDEFKVKMKKLGWDDEYINSILKQRDKEKEQGIVCPIEIFLMSSPLDDIDYQIKLIINTFKTLLKGRFNYA